MQPQIASLTSTIFMQPKFNKRKAQGGETQKDANGMLKYF